MSAPVPTNEHGDVIETLVVIGKRCRKFIADGNEKIAQVARIVTEAKVRIDRNGEDFPGGFHHWVQVYVKDPEWSIPKLLTAGGWREAKKTGEVPAPAAIVAKVAAVKVANQAARTRSERKAPPSLNPLEGMEPEPAAERVRSKAEEKRQHAAIMKPYYQHAILQWRIDWLEDQLGRKVASWPEMKIKHGGCGGNTYWAVPIDPTEMPVFAEPAAAPPVQEAEPQPQPEPAPTAAPAASAGANDRGWYGTKPAGCNNKTGICNYLTCEKIGHCQISEPRRAA